MKRGTPEHPKMLLLASTLEINNYAAVGLMECLWHFTARYAPQGDIGKYTDEIIAHKIGWDGDAEQLIQALLECGWLDQVNGHRLLVHDWHDHSDDAADKYLIRHNLIYANGFLPRRGGRVEKCLDTGGQNEGVVSGKVRTRGGAK